NYPEAAWVSGEKIWTWIDAPPASEPMLDQVGGPVIVLRAHPGIDPDFVDVVADHRNGLGVVLELYPTGSGPTGPNDGLDTAVARWREKGVCVVATVSEE